MTAPCSYRDLSDEAYRIDAVTGREERVDVWLCSWPVTLGPHPPWVRKAIGYGLAIEPEKDCANCPVRKG